MFRRARINKNVTLIRDLQVVPTDLLDVRITPAHLWELQTPSWEYLKQEIWHGYAFLCIDLGLLTVDVHLLRVLDKDGPIESNWSWIRQMPIRKTPAKSWIEDPQWVFHLHPRRELVAISSPQDVARVVP